ncbi:MAG TPA: hypothetical protein PLI45_04555 [Candidatus Woesebacteria bacterium]|nr:hypothetical protein [Candidatus Woesebacteria bacterium]
MKEKDIREGQPYPLAKMEVLKKVSDCGSLGDMESWKSSYPEIEFPEVITFGDRDDGGWETEIDWEERSIEEKVLYVMIAEEKEIAVEYVIESEVNEVCEGRECQGTFKVRQLIDDPHKIFVMWAERCFAEGELSEDAVRAFVEYSIADDNCRREYVDDADFEDIRVKEISVKLRDTKRTHC